jgi:hypothetical protein
LREWHDFSTTSLGNKSDFRSSAVLDEIRRELIHQLFYRVGAKNPQPIWYVGVIRHIDSNASRVMKAVYYLVVIEEVFVILPDIQKLLKAELY